MDCDGASVRPLELKGRRLLGETPSHQLQKLMATVGGEHDRLPPLGHRRTRLPLKRYMPHDHPRGVAGDDRHQFTALDTRPVASRGKNLRVRIVAPIHLDKAAGDRRGIGLRGQLDPEVSRDQLSARLRLRVGKFVGPAFGGVGNA